MRFSTLHTFLVATHSGRNLAYSTALVYLVLCLGCGSEQQSAKRSDETSPNQTAAAASPKADVHHDTAESAFEAHTRAIQAGEWEKVFHLLTPKARDEEVFELLFQLGALGSELPKRHEDPARVNEIEQKMREGVDEKQTRALVVGLLKDKQAFYVEAAAELADAYREHAPKGPLREVKVTGSRARGIVTGHIFSKENDGPMIGYPYDHPIYFSKGEHGWLIDFPSQEELEQDSRLTNPTRNVEAYHYCARCNTIQGGVYGGKPFKEFSGAKREECSHDWKEIDRQQFKELATRLYGFRWSDEPDEFWNR